MSPEVDFEISLTSRHRCSQCTGTQISIREGLRLLLSTVEITIMTDCVVVTEPAKESEDFSTL